MCDSTRVARVCVCTCVSMPVFPGSRFSWWFFSLRILKHVHENVLKLAENDHGDLEVALQLLQPKPEVLGEI